MTTDTSHDRLEKRLTRARAQLQQIQDGGVKNWQFSREWFDLHNEEVEIESSLRRAPLAADPSTEPSGEADPKENGNP